jgi:WhiB family redox-sensing transcriptional regulator
MSWQFSKDLDWMAQAACVGGDADAFFGGERGGRPSLRKLPCRTCNVRSECLAYALESQEPLLGVWGGIPLQPHPEGRRSADHDGARPAQSADNLDLRRKVR